MSDSPEISQSGRLLGITSPLGPDVLVLRHLSVTEAIGRPFVIEAEVLSAKSDLTPKDLLGKSITCTVALGTQPERHFNGMVRAFAKVAGHERGLTAYRLEAVPLLWNMTRTADCRIFQDQSVQAILQKLFGEASVAPARFGTLPSAPRPYCVQFHETDFDFASRLMDEVGAGYFFQHGRNDHTLTVTGANADFPQVPGETLVVRAAANEADAVTDWRVSGALQPGKHVGYDFDMLKPSSLLRTTAQTRLPTPDAATWEVYRWGAGQAVQPDGDPSTISMEQNEAGADSAEGRTEVAALFAGGKIKVKDGLDGVVTPWLVTVLRHEAMDETQLVGDGRSHYGNSFTAIPADRPWRNAAPRRRPAMPALQSAVVTGPSGEEIHCDAHGRVKVQFLWDRYGKKDQNTSCYVRVSQPWAGKWGGTWFLPRIGDEVLVGFLDGDPDKPVVLGSLHNQEAPPPYAMPSLNTQSGITTRSSKGGGKDNANLLRFEDKKGSEEVYVQAEFDMNVLVKHDLDTTVRNGNETRLVKTGKRTTTVEGNETLTVNTGNRETTIKTGNDTYTLSTGNLSQMLKMGNYDLKLSMGNMSTLLDLGNYSVKTSLGAVTIEAMQGITLKVGQSQVKLDQMGVTISGMMVKLDGKLQLDAQGTMTTVKGNAMLQASGAIVMIG
ncbi:type VI secretion system Vgr family protein [Belnapia sp. F-4-1]|uniref:type VI secretion system Vgr family protein n=1 Tax=Belnapia sp. F-4-1 TaxID=1545443 RepID=UPI0005BCA27F|nr:type VI secretion system tip protein TssI/VgrG [Belnapia sp. F-4-1]